MRERIVGGARRRARGDAGRFAARAAHARARAGRARRRSAPRLAARRSSGAPRGVHDRRVRRGPRAAGAARDGTGRRAALRGARGAALSGGGAGRARSGAGATTRHGGGCSRTSTTMPPRAIALLADMLAKREQWIGELRRGDRAAIPRARSKRALAAEIEGELASLAALFPPSLRRGARRPRALCRREPRGRARDGAMGVERSPRARPPAASRRPRCRCRSTGARSPTGCWSRRMPRVPGRQVNAKDGFPAEGAGAGAPLRAQRNEAMRALLRELAAVDGLGRRARTPRAHLPPPRYDDDAWAFVEALLEVLPRVAAELTLRLSRRRRDRLHAGHARRARSAGRARTRPPTCCSARLPDPASAGRRVPGHVLHAARPHPQADGGMGAGRRPDAVRRRRSDAVDLSLPRRRGAACSSTAQETGRIGDVAGRESRPAAQFPVAGGPRRLGERGLPGRAWRAQRSVARRRRLRARGRGARRGARAARSRSTSSPMRTTKRGRSSDTSQRRSRKARTTSRCWCARARISTRCCRRCAPRAFPLPRSSSTRWASGRRCRISCR